MSSYRVGFNHVIRWCLDKCILKRYTFFRFLVTCYFSKFGIEFDYKGDYIWWTWPWRRDQYTTISPWVSTSFEGCFKSLKDLDNMWDEYFEACSKLEEKSIIEDPIFR
jgi:hypothetical protein